MLFFHRAVSGPSQQERRLSPPASIVVIAGLSAALWAVCIMVAMTLWSML
jgi:hypothetical protein